MKFAIGLFLSLLIIPAVVAQDYLKNGIVKIKTIADDDGSGILVGRDQNQLFIITAKHVIENSQNDIRVSFNRISWDPFDKVEVVHVDDQLDIAVLRATVEFSDFSDDRITTNCLGRANLKSVNSNDDVTAIGHPVGSGWFQFPTSVSEVDAISGKIMIVRGNIQSGYSGGGIFDNKNRLLGMIIQVGAVEAIGLNINLIYDKLRTWGIPVNLLCKPPIYVKSGPFITGSLGVAVGVGGLILRKEAYEKYAIYKYVRLENDPIFRDSLGVENREALKDQADDAKKLSEVAMIAGGALVVGSMIWQILQERSRKKGRKTGGMGFQVYPVWNSYRNFAMNSSSGMQVGIRLKF